MIIVSCVFGNVSTFCSCYQHTGLSSLQAIANETGINFISVKGPELLNMVRLFLV